jgi:hypothetical protein
MGALHQHYRLEEHDGVARVRFDDPRYKTDTPPIEEVELTLLVLFNQSLALSSFAGDKPRADAFEAALVRMLERMRERPKDEA